MVALHHVYVTAHGEYTAAAWLGEKAQFGIRLPMATGASEPTKGTIWTPISNGDVAVDAGSQAGTNGTLTRTWTARIGPTGSPDNCDATMQADLGDDVWTFLNAIKSYLTSNFRWTHVKIAPILADGTYGAPSAVYTFTTPLVGTDGTGALPPEVAIAVSLRAPIIGRRGRGRIYIPGLGKSATIASDGTVASSCATALRDAMGVLVTNLENIPGTEDHGPLVSVFSAGAANVVRPSQVRVGSHFDAQRRRQHQVVETYVSANL